MNGDSHRCPSIFLEASAAFKKAIRLSIGDTGDCPRTFWLEVCSFWLSSRSQEVQIGFVAEGTIPAAAGGFDEDPCIDET